MAALKEEALHPRLGVSRQRRIGEAPAIWLVDHLDDAARHPDRGNAETESQLNDGAQMGTIV